MNKFIQIDEEGYFSSNGARVTDEAYGRHLLSNLFIDRRGFRTKSTSGGTEAEIFIEAFDDPFVARTVSSPKSKSLDKHQTSHVWQLGLNYSHSADFNLSTLALDPWDRFHGLTTAGIPFVFSRSAQMQFFDLVDSFEDDSFTVGGQQYVVKNIYDSQVELSPDVREAQFWSAKYQAWQNSGEAPGWELSAPATPLVEVLPQIKILKSRICILGAGTGHDAAYLASLGHIVTAVDLSEEAIDKAKQLNPETQNLKYVCADAFEFAKKHRGEFDLVFEHTFYCAIDPTLRKNLAQAYSQLLTEYGQLLGIFFILDRSAGPPFGVTEWELREQLKNHFDFLHWTRWKSSIPERLGKEHVIFAKKKST